MSQFLRNYHPFRYRRITYICHLSGGVASWMAAKRTIEKHGGSNVILLFADTKYEEASTYTFLKECVADLSPIQQFVHLADGRTPFEVFNDVKFLGNSRVDPCSRILKRELLDKWVKTGGERSNYSPLAASIAQRKQFTPDNCVQVFGYDWTETHRLDKLRRRFDPWPVEAPLQDPPYLEKEHIIQAARNAGLTIPRLYELGFAHNNCGGRCVKAGQAHYAHLLTVLPEVYDEVEREEEKLRETLGDVSILRDRRKGMSPVLTLKEFRTWVPKQEFDKYDYGSCSCFTGSMEDE